jgi:hypothetical protein
LVIIYIQSSGREIIANEAHIITLVLKILGKVTHGKIDTHPFRGLAARFAQMVFRITTLVLPNGAARLNPAFLNMDIVP